MLKVFSAILLAVTATTFAMDNMHRVELGLIIGKPVHVRLFFLLLTSFLVGCFSAMLVSLFLGAKSGKQGETKQDTEDEPFFSE